MSRVRTLILGVAAVSVAVIVALALTLGTPGGRPPRSRAACEQLVVPAYFEPVDWPAVYRGGKPPSDMVLDISGTGAGPAAEPDFRTVVAAARAAGVTVLGYISTVEGQRPLSEVETEIRDYAAWYGVTGIFLDRVSGQPAQLGYYRAIADYVRSRNPGAPLWLNPGDYPDQAYMSLGGVEMTFEGTYADYAGAAGAAVPAWARHYPASRFAHTVFAAPAADLAPALRLAAARNAGHVYVTDGDGGNPYQSLPGYWPAEGAAVASCGGGR